MEHGMIKFVWEGEESSVSIIEEPVALDEPGQLEDGETTTSLPEESDVVEDADSVSGIDSSSGLPSSSVVLSETTTSELARPFLSTPLDDFTVAEGFLLLIFLMLCFTAVVGLTKRRS